MSSAEEMRTYERGDGGGAMSKMEERNEGEMSRRCVYSLASVARRNPGVMGPEDGGRKGRKERRIIYRKESSEHESVDYWGIDATRALLKQLPVRRSRPPAYGTGGFRAV